MSQLATAMDVDMKTLRARTAENPIMRQISNAELKKQVAMIKVDMPNAGLFRAGVGCPEEQEYKSDTGECPQNAQGC
jgi:hypothetical protein